MSTSQILQFNPIINEKKEIKSDYCQDLMALFLDLNSFINRNNDNIIKKWSQAEYQFYYEFLDYEKNSPYHYSNLDNYNLYMISDIMIMLGLNLLPLLELYTDYALEINIERQIIRYKLISYFSKILSKEQIDFGVSLIDSILFADKLSSFKAGKFTLAKISIEEILLEFKNKWCKLGKTTLAKGSIFDILFVLRSKAIKSLPK